MSINFQRLGEELNECTNEKLTIRVGRYKGFYYVGDGKFEPIEGEFFIKTNQDTIFRVVSDDSSIIDDFDIIGLNDKVFPINKEKENTQIKYDEINVENKESLRAFFPKDKVGIEMFECVQSIPVRFRQDAIDTFLPFFNKDGIIEETWNLNDVDKVWTYYLIEILDEMTEEEKKKYGF